MNECVTRSELKKHNNSFYARYGKRILDVILSLFVLTLFWWVYLIVAILVAIKMGRPVIYGGERIGKDEKFYINYKFRSMTNATDENGVLLPAAQRLTRFGKLLRSTSLDELPAVWNILKGDLSFVGPRPLIVKYLPYFHEEERARHSVRPGLTGWAQVNGRNAVSWDDKFRMDVEYTQKMSLWFDLKIMLMTVGKVIKRSDIIQGSPQSASLHIVRADMTENKKADAENVTETCGVGQ